MSLHWQWRQFTYTVNNEECIPSLMVCCWQCRSANHYNHSVISLHSAIYCTTLLQCTMAASCKNVGQLNRIYQSLVNSTEDVHNYINNITTLLQCVQLLFMKMLPKSLSYRSINSILETVKLHVKLTGFL